MRFRYLLNLVIGIIILFALLGDGYSQKRAPDVEFVPTPREVVLEMLQKAKVTKKDVLYDLGCGDGRIVITAAKVFGARGVGVDIDPIRIKESKENARKAGVMDRVKFIEGDLFETDLREATVVTLYLTPELNLQVQPKLFRELKPSSRILSHDFDMGDWKPDYAGLIRNVQYHYPDLSYVRDAKYYLWILPANVSGTWRWNMSTYKGEQPFTLRLDQKFQEIKGHVSVWGKRVEINYARLVGEQLRFTIKTEMDKQKVVMDFNGRASGDTLKGTIRVQGGPFTGQHPWSASRDR